MKKFNVIKFLTYLTFGLCILGGWGYVNYTNYTIQQHQQQSLSENVVMITDEVQNIEVEQDILRHVQTSIPFERNVAPIGAPFLALEMPDGAVASAQPPPPDNRISDARFDLLEERILELEAEKEELKAEKTDIKAQIAEMFSIFKLDYENPMVNALVIPVLLYFFKRLFDLIFNRIEERLHHRFEEHEHEV